MKLNEDHSCNIFFGRIKATSAGGNHFHCGLFILIIVKFSCIFTPRNASVNKCLRHQLCPSVELLFQFYSNLLDMRNFNRLWNLYWQEQFLGGKNSHLMWSYKCQLIFGTSFQEWHAMDLFASQGHKRIWHSILWHWRSIDFIAAFSLQIWNTYIHR